MINCIKMHFAQSDEFCKKKFAVDTSFHQSLHVKCVSNLWKHSNSFPYDCQGKDKVTGDDKSTSAVEIDEKELLDMTTALVSIVRNA